MTAPRLRRAFWLVLSLATLAAAGGGLAGCGQKGPLYLPGETPQEVEPGIATGGAEQDDEKEEDAAAER